MTLAEATRQYQIALEVVRQYRHEDLYSFNDEYETAVRDVEKAAKVLHVAWLVHTCV